MHCSLPAAIRSWTSLSPISRTTYFSQYHHNFRLLLAPLASQHVLLYQYRAMCVVLLTCATAGEQCSVGNKDLRRRLGNQGENTMHSQWARDSSSTTWTGTELHMYQDIQTALDWRAEHVEHITLLTSEPEAWRVPVRRCVMDAEVLLRDFAQHITEMGYDCELHLGGTAPFAVVRIGTIDTPPTITIAE